MKSYHLSKNPIIFINVIIFIILIEYVSTYVATLTITKREIGDSEQELQELDKKCTQKFNARKWTRIRINKKYFLNIYN